MNTNVHLVFHIGGFEHHTIQPYGLGKPELLFAVQDAARRFCHEIGLMAVSITPKGSKGDDWQQFSLQLGSGREITISARDTTAYGVEA